MKKSFWYAALLMSLVFGSSALAETTVHQVDLAPITVSPYEPNFTVTLWTNPKGGYHWVWQDDHKNLWKLQSRHFIGTTAALPVGPAQEALAFTTTAEAFKTGPHEPLVFLYQLHGKTVEKATISVLTTCKPQSIEAKKEHDSIKNHMSLRAVSSNS